MPNSEDSPLAYPELAGSTPRSTRLTLAGFAGGCLAVLMIGVGLPLFPWLWVNGDPPVWTALIEGFGMLALPSYFLLYVRAEGYLMSEGRVAPGHVTDVYRRVRRSDVYGAYAARYQFTADSATYKGVFTGSEEECGAAGMPVTIIYDQTNPKRHRRYPMRFVRV